METTTFPNPFALLWRQFKIEWRLYAARPRRHVLDVRSFRC